MRSIAQAVFGSSIEATAFLPLALAKVEADKKEKLSTTPPFGVPAKFVAITNGWKSIPFVRGAKLCKIIKFGSQILTSTLALSSFIEF